jgi:hypothetical protein
MLGRSLQGTSIDATIPDDVDAKHRSGEVLGPDQTLADKGWGGIYKGATRSGDSVKVDRISLLKESIWGARARYALARYPAFHCVATIRSRECPGGRLAPIRSAEPSP